MTTFGIMDRRCDSMKKPEPTTSRVFRRHTLLDHTALDKMNPENDLQFISDNDKVETKSDNYKLTEKKQKILEEFKKSLHSQGEDVSDAELVRWLKARNFDIKKAEAMYKQNQEFRKLSGVDRILEEYRPSKVISEYLSCGICGYDKEGSPVNVELFGRLDMYGLMHSCRKSELTRAKLHHCEKVAKAWKDQSEKLGRSIHGLVVLFDMSEVSTRSLWRPGLQMYLYLVQMLEDNYPEMLKQLFVINAPSYFNLFWYVCKPLVSEDMRRKIFVCGKNYSDTLLQYIDPEELPMCFGGKKTDQNGDPKCSELICQGGEVPKESYIDRQSLKIGMKHVTLLAGQVHDVLIQVEEAGQILRWEFITEQHDIDYSVIFVTNESKESVENCLVSHTHAQSHVFVEDGYIVCSTPGKYLLRFDNTRSWYSSKTVHYKTSVEKTLTWTYS